MKNRALATSGGGLLADGNVQPNDSGNSSIDNSIIISNCSSQLDSISKKRNQQCDKHNELCVRDGINETNESPSEQGLISDFSPRNEGHETENCMFSAHISQTSSSVIPTIPKTSTTRCRRRQLLSSDSLNDNSNKPLYRTPEPPRPKKPILMYETPLRQRSDEGRDDNNDKSNTVLLQDERSTHTDHATRTNIIDWPTYTPPQPRRLVFDDTEDEEKDEEESEAANYYQNSKSLITTQSRDAIFRFNNNNDNKFELSEPYRCRRRFLPVASIRHIPQLIPKLRRRIKHIRFSPPRQQRLLIPSNHPMKILWDLATVSISLINAYATHIAIGDRSIGSWHGWQNFCQLWFVIDIILNFVTEHKMTSDTDERILTNCQAVWARYLTTWFVVDLLSLVPGEVLFVKPIIDQQKRRGFFQRQVFRVRNVSRFLFHVITKRLIRPKHVSMFSTVAKHSKRAGIGGPPRLIRLIIKYVPKYVLFLRKMKGLIALRVLRQFHWFQKVWKNLRSLTAKRPQQENLFPSTDSDKSCTTLNRQGRIDDDTISLTCDDTDFDEDYDIQFYDDGNGEKRIGNSLDGTEKFVQIMHDDGIHSCPTILMSQSGSWNECEDDSSNNQILEADDNPTEDEDDDFDGGYPY